MSDTLRAPVFDVGDYLDRRAESSPFTMVELGHGRYPLIANQPHFFTGDREYIGIEAGMRSGLEKAGKLRDKLEAEFSASNATFVVHDLGGSSVYESADVAEVRYEGAFEPRTALSDGVGHEVVASNVLGDDLIAEDSTRTIGFLGEMARLATQDGVVILRETISPEHSSFLRQSAVADTAAAAGLVVAGRVGPDILAWDQLELVYGTHKEWTRSAHLEPESFYLFLAKSTQAEPATGPDA